VEAVEGGSLSLAKFLFPGTLPPPNVGVSESVMEPEDDAAVICHGLSAASIPLGLSVETSKSFQLPHSRTIMMFTQAPVIQNGYVERRKLAP
jgi:hypothetical protein